MVVWLIGLAGAGKSTIARALKPMFAKRWPTVIIEGEDVRRIVGVDIGFSSVDRRNVGEALSRICRFLEQQSISVICPVSGLFEQVLEWNRKELAHYVEVYIEVPIEEIIERDQHQLYTRALRGECSNVVGVDLPFDPPKQPHLIVFNGKPLRSPEELAMDVFKRVSDLGYPE